jgi:RNA ligase
MLHVQNYLKSGKTLDDLNKELGINAAHHPELPLVILNYDMIESPKTHPVVRECRGIVLDKTDWSLVARAFSRFFNWGEVADEMPLFNWNNFLTQEKVDGSLVLLYNYKGQWLANTRGSFGLFPILNTQWEADFHNLPKDTTWQNAFCKALKVNNLQELNLDPNLTYVCEFCSPWNKVVRSYNTPQMFLLSTFQGEQELGPISHELFQPLNTYKLNNDKEITDFLNSHPEATFEGVVIKDNNNRRWKIKNTRYVALHRMKGNNGDELANPKNLLPYILQGEGDELLTYFPEIKDVFNSYKDKVNNELNNLIKLYEETQNIENQKEFALAIKDKTKFTSVLFTARKTNSSVKKVWSESTNIILKVIFDK